MFERGLSAPLDGFRHERLDEPQGRLLGQCGHRNADWLAEGQTAAQHALAITAVGERRGGGLADLLK